MITLEDAAVVSWPQGNKKPTTRQLHGGSGALGGAFWGFLFGLIFFVPFLGAAMGAAMGAGSMADVGISDDFIKQVREKVTEGTSALFALTSGATAPDKIIDELKQYDFLWDGVLASHPRFSSWGLSSGRGFLAGLARFWRHRLRSFWS